MWMLAEEKKKDSSPLSVVFEFHFSRVYNSGQAETVVVWY